MGKQNAWLLRVTEPFDFDGRSWEYFVAMPRRSVDNLSMVDTGNIVTVDTIRTTKEQVESDEPFKTKSWKDEQGFIGTIILDDSRADTYG